MKNHEYQAGHCPPCDFGEWKKDAHAMGICGKPATVMVNQTPLRAKDRSHAYLCPEHRAYFQALNPNGAVKPLREVP